MTLLKHTNPAITLEDTNPISTLEDTDPTSTFGTSEVSDERFLAECFKNIQGVPTIMMDAVAEACGMPDWNSALIRLVELTAKHHIFQSTPGIVASRMIKLNPGPIASGGPATTSDPIPKHITCISKLDATAIATGGPATTSDRVTKHLTSISKKKGIVRIVRKCEHKLSSATQDEDIAQVNEAESSQEGLTCAAAANDADDAANDTGHDSDMSSQLTYWSSTYKEESISVDEHSRPFYGITLDQMEDIGLTVSHLVFVKRARKTGTMAELLADKTPEQVAKFRAAEELLQRAAERSKADESK